MHHSPPGLPSLAVHFFLHHSHLISGVILFVLASLVVVGWVLASWEYRPRGGAAMKIQCDACEGAAATVVCCADEAALCARCDVEIHAANKLASKHQRLPLEALSAKLPRCDVCQVRTSSRTS
jgi:hypothetical protein